jgi:hypothetical protein
MNEWALFQEFKYLLRTPNVSLPQIRAHIQISKLSQKKKNELPEF